jgi:crotonobetainyl-CoA:carnitine CoA-transferase CaiB-like acyl-CoA transferase
LRSAIAYEDPHTQAIGFMTPTRSRAFLDQAPEGKYWRHAPPVKFSETPCEAGKPYEGLGVNTRSVLAELGYEDATIERLVANKAIGLGH